MNPQPDRQKVTLDIYRYADENETYYVVQVKGKKSVSASTIDRVLNRAIHLDVEGEYYSSDFETALDLALQYGDLFPGKEWVG